MGQNVMYTEGMIMCGALLLIMFHLHIREKRAGASYKFLKGFYLLTLLELTLDTIWIYLDGRSDMIFWHKLLQTVYLTGVPFEALLWFGYSAQKLRGNLMKTRRSMLICAAPIAAVAVLTLFSWNSGIIFRVDEAGVYTRGSLMWLPNAVAYGYIIASSVLSYLESRRVQSLRDKRELRAQAFSVLLPVAMGITQLLLPPGIALTYYGLVMAMFYMYTVSLERQITHDELTKLCNNYSIDRLLDEAVERQKKRTVPLCFVICDMDKFKSINDEFGHLTGDEALCEAADILEREVRKHGCFAGRLHGDEFALVAEYMDGGTTELMMEDIMAGFAERSAELPYSLEFSYGMARYTTGMTKKELFEKADKRLYEMKKRKKQKRQGKAE